MSVKLTFIPNIIEDTKIEGLFSPGLLQDILKEFYLLRKNDYPNLIKTKVRIEKKKLDSEDWDLIPPIEWIDYKIEDNTELRIIPSYTGGGGSFGTIMGAILFVAGVAVFALVPGGQAAGAYMMLTGASMVIGTALSYTGSPVFGTGPDLASTSSTYSWEDQPNQTDPGLPVPIIYGTHRVTPHLINAYIDQTIEFIWNLQYNSSTPTTVVQAGGINVFTTETALVQGLSFILNNPNANYSYDGEGASTYQDPCDFKIEYAKSGDSYTEYGKVTIPGLSYAPGLGIVGELHVQIKDLPIGQYNIRLTNLGTSNFTMKYWSSVEEGRKTTIRSEGDTQYLYMLYGVCEGQIESICDLEVNGTRLDSFEEKPEYWVRLGTNDLAGTIDDYCENLATIPHDPLLCNKVPISYFNDVRNYKAQGTSGGQKLSSNVAVPMTTDGTNIGSILYHLRIPSLYKINPSSGDMEENSVDIRMQYRLQGDPDWSTAWDVTIKSNTRAPVNRYFRIPTTNYLTAGKYEVQVTKLSQDSTDLKSVNDIYFMGIYEIQDLNLSYPNTALLAVRMKATGQVSGGLPKVSCLVKGRKILQLTAGTIDHSSNPVNCLYDLLTNQRYGLGNYLETANINLPQWKAEEVYCNGTVDGLTRFKLDMVIDGLASAFDLITRMCLTFRGLPIYSEGVINVTVEKDTDTPVQIFNVSNILANSLTVNYFDKTQVPNVVEVQYANEQRNYDMDFAQIRTIETEIATIKEIKKRIAVLGITRPNQAIRIGKWIYNAGIYIGRSISFKAMMDAVHCQPGDLFEFQHDVLQIGFGGRVISATTTTITLDKEVTIVAATSYVITGRLANDTVETKAVNEATTTGGVYPWTGTVIQMAEAFTTAPPISSPYAFGTVAAESVTYRIVKISKDPDFNVTIEGIEFNSSIYAESGFAIPHRSPTMAIDVFGPPGAVTDLTLTEADNEYGIIVSFNLPYPMGNWNHADIQLSVDGGLTYRSIATVYGGAPYVIKDLIPGMQYWVRVISYSHRGVMCKTPAIDSIWLGGYLRGHIYGLQIKGQGASQYWNTRDCEFVWRCDSVFGRGGTFDYFRVVISKIDGTLIREEQVKEKYYNYSLEKNKKDNGVALATFEIQISAVNTMGFESLEHDSLIVINPAPVTPGGLGSNSLFRAVYFYWTTSWEPDHDHYSIRTKLGSGSWSAWISIETNFYTRTLTQAEINSNTVNVTIYFEVKDIDAFDQSSLVASDNELTESIRQVDMRGERFQVMPTDSDGNSEGTLKTLYDAVTTYGGVTYSWSGSWGYIQFEYPVSFTFNQTLLWLSASINCYIGYSEDDITYAFLKGEADHTLDGTGKLLEATNEADAQTNYWTTGLDSTNARKAVWAYMRQARYVRLYFKSNVTIYEIKHWVFGVFDEIESGIITSKTITLSVLDGSGDVKIQTGKTDFGDNTSGFILGLDDSDSNKAKFEIGNSGYYFNWSPDQLIVHTVNCQMGVSANNQFIAGYTVFGAIGTDTYDAAQFKNTDLTGRRALYTKGFTQMDELAGLTNTLVVYGNSAANNNAIAGISIAGPQGWLGHSHEGVHGQVSIQGQDGVAAFSTASGISYGMYANCAAGTDCFDFYAGGSATNYGPFTGAHQGLVKKDFIGEEGDILADVKTINKSNISNTISLNELSSRTKQSNVVGVLVSRGPMSYLHFPSSLMDREQKLLDPEGNLIDYPIAKYSELMKIYDIIALNAVGEGMINVCKEGGNIKAGDYICSSNWPGKGMKQDDDILHSYTIAKSREDCIWNDIEDNIKSIACTYHGG